MRYSVLGFNQEELLKYNLGMNEVLLLDYIYQAIASPTLEHKIEAGLSFVWLNHTKILEDLPILNISEDRLKRLLKSLEANKLISSIKINMGKGKGSKCYYYITKECEALRYNRRVENNTSNDLDVLKITPLNSDRRVENNTSNNKLFNIDNKLNKIDNKRIECFIDSYHSICISLPKVRSITDKRKKAILKIINKYSKSELEECFRLAEESDFLTGNNDRGWKADIDFILREDKLIAILEGKYGGKKKTRSTARDIERMNKRVQSLTDEEKKEREEFIANGRAKKF